MNFNTMFLLFILTHCTETDNYIIGDSFKDADSLDFKMDFNHLIELFLTETFDDDSYFGCKSFNKKDLREKLLNNLTI